MRSTADVLRRSHRVHANKLFLTSEGSVDEKKVKSEINTDYGGTWVDMFGLWRLSKDYEMVILV